MSAVRGLAVDVVETTAQAEAGARPPLLVLEPLAAFLDEHGIGAGPIAARCIGAGHSNVTFALTRADTTVVLRRPPRPPLPPAAHDVLREARFLRALHPAGVRVPRVLATCDDPGVIGVPFYIMDYIDGYVLGDEEPDVFNSEEARRRIGEELVDTLVELHAVDSANPAVAALGRGDGYLERQLHRFSSTWDVVATRDVPEIAALTRWLSARRPTTTATTVVHGDYRLGNLMYERGDPRLHAVLDWEMATLGDPLADLGYLCATWAEADDEENVINRLSRVTRSPGYPSTADLCERYAAESGRDVADLRFYEVLALWKAAVFLEASYRRYREGSTDDPYFAALAAGVPELARHAWSLTQ